MTSGSLCRLCLNGEQLVNVFDKRLRNGHQLRMCIFLCTGVEIKRTDKIPKLICHKCCSLSVKLFEFRQIALANDKALKELANQPFAEIPTDKNSVATLHASILENISKPKICESAAKVYKVPLEQVQPVNNEDRVDDKETRTEVHDSVKEIFQYFPTITVPLEILEENILPFVNLDEKINYKCRVTETDDDDDCRIRNFKRKHKSINLVNISLESNEKPQSSLDYLSDSDTNPGPVFKSKKKKLDVNSDDDCVSGCDSESESIDTEDDNKSYDENRKERLRPHRNKTKIFDYEDDNEAATKKSAEPYSKYCDYCDRYFWGYSQLKAHQRVHFRCYICKKGFESPAILDEHQMTVCLRTLACKKIVLDLERVDENLKLLEEYKDAFDTYFQDIAGGVYGDPDLIKSTPIKSHLYHTEKHRLEEKEMISEIFNKFKDADNNPITKNKLFQTKRIETEISCANSSEIVLDDVQTDLCLFRIPVAVVVDRIQSAYISYPVKKSAQNKPLDSWSSIAVTNIINKSKVSDFKQPTPITTYSIKAEPGAQMIPRLPILAATLSAAPRKRFSVLSKPKKVGFGPRTKQFVARNTAPKGPAGSQPKQNYYSKMLQNISSGVSIRNNSPTTIPHLTSNANFQPPMAKPQPANGIPDVTKPTSTSSTIEDNSRTRISNFSNGTTQNVLSISGEVTLEKNNPPKSNNSTTQNSLSNAQNILNDSGLASRTSPSVSTSLSYPPRPNTAIRNILESISSEISIEPNYQRQAKKVNSGITENSTMSHPEANSFSTMDYNTTSYQSMVSSRFEASVKEESVNEEAVFTDPAPEAQLRPATGYGMDYVTNDGYREIENYPLKAETMEVQNYDNVYQQNTVSNINFNAGYPQYQPVRYQTPQYFRQPNRPPIVTQRFNVGVHNINGLQRPPQHNLNPYQNTITYKVPNGMNQPPSNHLNVMYPSNLNGIPSPMNQEAQRPAVSSSFSSQMSNMPQSSVQSNALASVNSYNNPNFMPSNSNAYDRSYSDRYNTDYNNPYQPSYQPQYIPPYSSPAPQHNLEYNTNYTDSLSQVNASSKFLRVKQPWELYKQ